MAVIAFLLFSALAQVTAAASTPSVAPKPVTAAPVTLTLRLTDQRRQFRPGEIISIELEFSSATTKRFTVDGATYDRSGRLTIDEFVIDRIDDVSDPMLDYFGSSGAYIGGGIRSMGVLGEKPFTVKLELNEWFRFDKPGKYTLAVKSRRVTDESVTPHAVVAVESNTVSFEILPRDATWEASELEGARRIIDARQPPFGSRPGCRIMRFLGTEAAVMEMIRRYGADADQGCDFDYMAGLFSAEDREAIVRAMEDGLRAADQAVTGSYLRTLSTLSVYLQHPELRPAQTREMKGRLVTGGELSRRSDLIDAAQSVYGDILTAAMQDKTDRARAITLAEMQALAQRQPSAASAASQDQLAARFLDLPAQRQANLLEYQWRVVAGSAMLPALRRLVDAPPTDAPSVPDLALRRLAQMAPDEARPLILREIRNPRRGATLKTLGSLQDAELPELDDALAANFEASTSEIHAALVQRYATRKVAARILASAGDEIGVMACRQQTSILAYFLRVDESTGSALLDRAMTSRATGCWRFLNEIAAVRMTPVVQTRAIADLDDSDPDVVIAAIQTLGQHGSPAALEPLRTAFQRWHATWADRAAELAYSFAVERPNARQAMVEDAFRQAIGTGRGWLVRASDLRELQSLCVTDNCRTQTGYMIHEDDTRIMLWSINEADESNIELAQYRFTSIAALEEKLSQYPRGTAFILQRSANESGDVTAAIRRLTAFAASRDLSINER
ncbi:MAG TPA: HEAT repeat domain-containing protein [Vicinamibacterales bacterium]|nr:HEAT repeat domain-containing protein [Vicinamibacterales bacterium]